MTFFLVYFIAIPVDEYLWLSPARSLLYTPHNKAFYDNYNNNSTVEKRIEKSSSCFCTTYSISPLLQYRHLFMHIFRSFTTSHNWKYEILTKNTSITKTGPWNWFFIYLKTLLQIFFLVRGQVV